MLEQIEKFFCRLNSNPEAYITHSLIQSLATLHPNLKDCNIDYYSITYLSKTDKFLDYLLKVQDISEKSMLKILEALSSDSKYYKLPEYQEIHKHIYYTMLIKYPKVKILLDKILKILSLNYNFPTDDSRIIIIRELRYKGGVNYLTLYRLLLEYLFKYSLTSLQELCKYLNKSLPIEFSLKETIRKTNTYQSIYNLDLDEEYFLREDTVLNIKKQVFHILLQDILDYDRPTSIDRDIFYFKYKGYCNDLRNVKDDCEEELIDLYIKNFHTKKLETLIKQSIKEYFVYKKIQNLLT